MSSLFGFRESYYRGLGYEACGWRWSLQARESCLPRTSCSLPIRQGSLSEDLNEIEAVFDRFIRGQSGCFLRTEADWRHRIGAPDLGLYIVGDPAEAYCSIRIKGFFQHVEVQEMAWTTREGYDGLWTILRGAAKNQEGVKWTEPPASPFLARYMDHGVEAESAGWSMHRVVNFPEALRQICPISGAGEFTIRLEDDLFPENQGPWQVSWNGRGAEVSPAGEAGLALDVRAASQALMGSPSHSELARHGWVEVRNPAALAAAEAFFGAWSVTYMDPF
jgi:predicted acetyltransferase